MRTQEITTPQMDEIVFEKRNKFYGAYILRKMYHKQLSRALFLTTAILIAGLAYPLVSSYTTKKGGKHIWIESGFEVMRTEKPPVELPDLPSLPPNTEPLKKIVFRAPEIVIGEVPEDEGLPTQDILNQIKGNDPVAIIVEPASVKKADAIEESEPKNEIFIIAEEMPSYPGGDAERQKFLAETIQYPKQAVENGIQGTIYVQFIIDSKGNITDVKILRGIGGGCDEEALRVIKMMPPWHPGKQNGKTVRVLYHMPVSFKLH